MIRILKVNRETRTGVPYITTTVRVYGQPQIDVFHAMCAATGRQPHELAGDIVTENLWEAGSQRGLRDEGRRARSWRLAQLRRQGPPADPPQSDDAGTPGNGQPAGWGSAADRHALSFHSGERPASPGQSQ